MKVNDIYMSDLYCVSVNEGGDVKGRFGKGCMTPPVNLGAPPERMH